MSGINDSIIAQLEQLDPDEAEALKEELDAEEMYQIQTEEEVILEYDFD